MRVFAGLLLLALTAPTFAKDPSFSGSRTYSLAAQIVRIGPRPSASQEIETLRRLIRQELARDHIQIEEHAFTATTPVGPKPMVNLIAKIPGESKELVILAGHYDTKPFSDGTRFVGANDGASSTAAMLEAAHVLARSARKKYTTWIIFHDGEESQSGPWIKEDSLHGARKLAARLEADGVLKTVRALINIDMIGNKSLSMLVDTNSTPWLNDLVRSVAKRLGKESVFNSEALAIDDDHMPYLAYGVPSVNLIDFTSYETFWHRSGDTIDKLSSGSLGDAGSIVIATIDALGTR